MSAVFTKTKKILGSITYSMVNSDGSGVVFTLQNDRNHILISNSNTQLEEEITKEEFMEAFTRAIELISIPTAAL